MNISLIESFKRAFKTKKAVVVMFTDNILTVHHYATCIFRLSGTEIEIDNGGYFTKTTKNHLNLCFELVGKKEAICQKKFEWYLSNGQLFERHLKLKLA